MNGRGEWVQVDTFTMQDILSNEVSYRHDGSETKSDRCQIFVSNDHGEQRHAVIFVFLFLNFDIKYKFSENPNKKWPTSARNLDPFDWWWCTSHHNKHGFDLFGIWYGRGTNGTNNLGDLDNSRPGHKGHQHYLSSVWNAKTRGCYQYRSRGRRHSIQPSRR